MRSSKIGIAATAVALSLAVTGAVLVSRAKKPRAGAPTETTTTADVSDEVAAAQREVNGLRGEIAALRTLVATSTLGAAAPIAGHPQAGEGGSASSAKAIEPPADPKEFVAKLETTFRVEAVDGPWASKVNTSLADALRADDVKLNAHALECRSRTCRLELPGTGPTDAAYLNLAARVAGDLPNIFMDHQKDAAGHPIAVLYLSRASETPSL